MQGGGEQQAAARCPVAVIGASAGGLEALIALVSQIERDSRIAFVIVQHLAPDQKSVLHELLQNHCAIPVTQITSHEMIEPGHVYVVPPGKAAEIADDTLRLFDRDTGNALFRPIDRCFESLAEHRGRDGYCIVLSGTGSDGANGLRAVKEAGGITFAQESETARFPGMPDAAVATGLVDFILPDDKIVPRLQQIVGHRRIVDDDVVRAKLREEIEAALPRIAEILRDTLGHDFSSYKPGTMVRRIERRMNLLRVGDVETFIARLKENEEEARNLGQEFLIGVTEFFRDPAAFDSLRREVVEPLAASDETTIRVWVPGCSTGEEAYSLAILFTEALEARGRKKHLQIFGTDIDGRALLSARAGSYPAASFKKMDQDRLARFFQPDDGGFRARNEIRECCVFAPHNMLQDPPFSRLDLISCRNLMIYLSTDLQKKVLPRFHFSLREGGHLFLGPSEGVSGGEDLFKTVDKVHRIFRRNDGVGTHYSSLRDPVPRAGSMPVSRSLRPDQSDYVQPSISREVAAEREFLRGFAQPFAVVSEDGEVRYLSHAMTQFARPSQGTPSNQIDALLLPPLRVPVRSALQMMDDSGEAQTIPGVVVDFDDGPVRLFDVSVAPMRADSQEYLIVLTEVRPLDAEGVSVARDKRETADRDILEEENVRLRRQLSAIQQEHETSGQELKSTNEELMSMNEELQSSNEELETSREELQSINEELETVNAELRENNRQLIRANSDLANLFESTDLAVLFLDRAFGVRNFTPGVTALFAIKPRDIGRSIFDLTSRIDYPEFREDAKHVDDTLSSVEREVRIDTTKETFLLRMKPYRTTDNRIDGYVLSFVDITGRKRNEEMLERQRQDLAQQYAELENLYDTTPVGLSLVDRDMRYLRINERLAAINGVSVDEHLGRTFEEVMPDLAAEMSRQYGTVFDTGEPLLDLRIDADFPDAPGDVRNFIVDLFPVFLDGEVVSVGTCVREITEQQRLVNDLAESEGRMQRIFDATPVNILLTRGPDHVIAYSNPANTKAAGNREMVGRPIAEALPELKGQNIFEKFDETFQAGERKVFGEFRVELDDGAGGTREMWLSQVLEPQRDGSGNVIGVVSFAYEITEQVRAREAARESEAQKTLLLAELQHRVKNTLATVRAISRFLLTGSDDARHFHDRLSKRLGAMSRTHDLLTDSDWASTNLCDLVAAEAAPYERAGNGRIHYYGDTLRLNAKEALAFGMAMHELMTNAAKYGALSNETGHIEIDVAATAEGRRVTWREVGGPEVREPENGGGFGMVVIQRVLSSDIGANIDMRFEPSGLIFEARF